MVWGERSMAMGEIKNSQKIIFARKININVGQNNKKTLAVFCSDGRFTGAIMDFVRGRLGAGNCDIIAIPGAIFFLLCKISKFSRVAKWLVGFLVEHHSINRLIVIQHRDCGLYNHLHGAKNLREISKIQISDVEKLSTEISSIGPNISFEGYFLDFTSNGTDDSGNQIFDIWISPVC
ncbi:hypothetical protein HY227_01720 [Candidatus Wolfebacteria bacterium]|nr:hypothetical protein [Candidatus Wolfebacteria bacterium]